MRRFFVNLGGSLCLISGGAQASDITSIRFGDHETYTRIVIESEQPLNARAFTLAEPVSRLVVSFEVARWNVGRLPNAVGQGSGLIGEFRFDGEADAPRLVLALNAPARVQEPMALAPNGGGYRTVVDVARTSQAVFQQLSGFPDQVTDLTRLLAEHVDVSITLPTCEAVRVVIDPGHGGHDPGAPARFGGGDEADVNLAAGLVLRDLLNASGRYKVIMTRDRDEFVDLWDRVDIAREAEADFFISLHADASAKSSRPRGATVYSMNSTAVNRARTRAIRGGDWVDPDRPEDVSRILVEMSLNHKESQSELFSETLRAEVGRVQTLWRDQAMRANFAVLTDASVPAVLFEMGFMTNREDARRLNSAAERRRLMQSVTAAIDSHFAHCGGDGSDAHPLAPNSANASSMR